MVMGGLILSHSKPEMVGQNYDSEEVANQGANES